MAVATRIRGWTDERAPGLGVLVRKHYTRYYAPKNLNFWYFFGALNLVVLMNQIVTGLFLAINYSATEAFHSVEYIMRRIKPQWYFTRFYAILRMVPSYFGTPIRGVLAMFASILLLMLLPWIDHGQVRSVRYRGTGFKLALGVFAASFLGLGAVGSGLVDEAITAWFPRANVTLWESAFGCLMTACYFGFFVFLGGGCAFRPGKSQARPLAPESRNMMSRIP